jgi:formate C-acetyltransferase
MQQRLWGTFDAVREHLEQQYVAPAYQTGSGLAPEQLAREAERYLALHTGQARVLQKANLYRLILEKGRIQVDPQDFFADKLQHGGILTELQTRWHQEVKDKILPGETAWMDQARDTGYLDGVLDLGHTSPGWTTLMTHGLRGLLRYAQACRSALGDAITREQSDFYDAVEIVYTATIRLAGRFRSLAMDTAQVYPEHTARLDMIADALSNVPANPPRSFHEALQFAYIMHQMVEMEGERVRSMGGFDRLFLPFYRADIASGKLDREQAKELIKFFWIKFFAHTRGVANGKNFFFGGCLEDGSDAANELSTLALEAYDDLDTTDPKLSVRVGKNTPDALLSQVTRIIRQGKTSFVLVNDDVAIPALVRHGKTLEDARNYLLIGCYEPAIEGLEIACNMSLEINLAKTVELALNNGVDPVSGIRLGPATGEAAYMASYSDFYESVLRQIDAQVDRATEYVRQFEPYWPVINPSPVLAGSFTACLKKGKDIGQAGPKYNNTGCMGAGLANVADSLIAVKHLVFDEKRCTMAELTDALRNNFVGYEDLHRTIVYRLPKWGNDIHKVDVIARQIADHYTARVNATPNTRGGSFRASMFTLDYRYRFGKLMGATPDGRLAGTYLAGGVGAMTARDAKGITALINSVATLPFLNIPNGSVLDIYLHPSAVQGEDGLAAFVAMIRTFFAKGGFGIQFNVFDSQTLRDARKHPEKYATLQVRVCGWNVYFTSMSPYEQEQYIEANKHLL